jgi:alkylation response protein AidB-like acyl-CoA dehydrogenase
MIGEENSGFKLIMHGMNAERILIGAEALGLGLVVCPATSNHLR